MIAFCGRKIIAQKNNAFINICVNMSVICVGIYFLVIFTSGVLVGRLPVYFELYNIISVSYTHLLNGDSIVGKNGLRMKLFAQKLMKKELVHFVASRCV